MFRAPRSSLPVMLVAVAAAANLAGQRGAGGGPAPAREATITAIPGVVAAGSTWMRAWQGTDNADGLVAAPDGGLLFAQEQPDRVSKLDANDRVSVVAERSEERRVGTGRERMRVGEI